VNGSSLRPKLVVTADGEGIAGHCGTRLLADVADVVGLTGGLVAAMAPICQAPRVHAPGRVLLDLALMLADGGDCLSDLATLSDQPCVFGPVASVPTAYRAIHAVDDARLAAIRAGRAGARARAWQLGAAPASITLDFDATLLTSHSVKDRAAATYKHGFGFYPLGCWLDETGEALAMVLRPGNAGSGTAADHVAVLDLALAQLPVACLGVDAEAGVAMLARADSAGASHEFLDALRARRIEFSVGLPVTEAVRVAILALPKKVWVAAIDADGDIRDGAAVAELTGYLDLTGWPSGTRAIVRREQPHPGAQFNLFDPDGWRHQVLLTDSGDDDVAYLEARHRGHARVEDRIRCAKATGLENLPFHAFSDNAAWVELVLVATDIISWTQILTLDGELAKAEPKRLRYCLLHVAGRISRTGRRNYLRLHRRWRWTEQLTGAFTRAAALAAIP
jgi:hypothetical protein